MNQLYLLTVLIVLPFLTIPVIHAAKLDQRGFVAEVEAVAGGER
jgi:hypothetical protein